MGNHTSYVMVANNKETIQVVFLDNGIMILPKSVQAWQIMEEFPEHLVYHYDSFYIGQKMPSLSPKDQPMAGNHYFLLPNHFVLSPLSLLSLASLISPLAPPTQVTLSPAARASPGLRSIRRASLLCQSFDIQKRDVGGSLQIKIYPEFIIKLIEEGRVNVHEHGLPVSSDSADDEPRLCNTSELQNYYEWLVKSRGHYWRPKLESIREKEENVTHKIFMKIKRSILMKSS